MAHTKTRGCWLVYVQGKYWFVAIFLVRDPFLSYKSTNRPHAPSHCPDPSLHEYFSLGWRIINGMTLRIIKGMTLEN